LHLANPGPSVLEGGVMGTVETVEVTDSKGNKIIVNKEDAGNYKKAPASKPSMKTKKK
jgi:hypothetical protein